MSLRNCGKWMVHNHAWSLKSGFLKFETADADPGTE